MKKIIIPATIWVVLIVLGWHLGSRWADAIEGAKRMDAISIRASRQGCLMKGVGAACVVSLIITPVLFAWLRKRETEVREEGG